MQRAPRRFAAALAFVVALAAATAVAKPETKVSEAVCAALRGKIVLSRGPVVGAASDKEMIAKLKAAQLRALSGTATDDGLAWRFHYTAFLEKTGSLALKVQFISGEKDRRFAAETAIPVADPGSGVAEGDLAIAESQGLERGKAYVLQIVNDKGETLAKTSAIFQ